MKGRLSAIQGTLKRAFAYEKESRMKEPKFAIGDVVTLKSGGPPMTVQKMDVDDVDFEEYVLCKWFDAENKLCTEAFAPATLELRVTR